MKRISRLVLTTALILITLIAFASTIIAQNNIESQKVKVGKKTMKIRITVNKKVTVFELNNSQAARDLYAQLPLSINVENYGDNEKIFYPPNKLNTTNTPPANAKAGTLAYYAPWGDVVMFYADFGSANGLYELGHAISGGEYISDMNGTLRLEESPEL